MLHRTLGGIVLAKSKGCSTIRLETGETRKILIPCLSRIGDRIHVYINWSTNKVTKVSTVGCPDHWNGDVEPKPVDIPDETEDIPHLECQSLEDQEVLGRPRSEGVGSLEFPMPISEDDSILDDVFKEDYYTQAGEPSHKLFKELL